MEFEPELFADGCDRPLPVDRIVDEYEIGEILALRVAVGDVDIPVLVNPFGGTDKTLDRYLNRGLYRRGDGLVHSYASAMGGVSVEYLAADEVDRAQQPLVETALIESPVDALATSTIRVGDQDVPFQLDADVARALLDGQPTLIRASDSSRVRRFEVRPAPRSDEGLTLEIRDLADFLASGTIDFGGLRSPRVRLEPEQVREIVSTGRTTATVSGATVELTTATDAVASQSALTSTPAPDSSAPPPGGVAYFGPPDAPYVQPTLASLPLAIYMPIIQRWELLGYSRGALVHSVGLAPQEELTLEVHSWQKFTTGQEDTTTTELTVTTDSTDTTRDSNEVLNETGNQSDLRNNLGGNLGYSGYGLSVNLNGGFNDGGTLSSTFRNTTSDFHELVVKTTNQLKSTRQVKVTEGSDIGSEERVTRHLRNPNTCRALSIDTFEILVHYEITTSISRAGARPCVLIEIPLPFGWFTRAIVREYETILSGALLAPSLRPGFAAARLLAERDVACQVACERCLCGDAQTILLSPGVSDALTRVRSAAKALTDRSTHEALFWVDAAVKDGANQNYVQFDPTKHTTDRDRLHRWIYTEVLKDENPALYRLLIDPGTLDQSDPVLATRSILGALAGADAASLRGDILVARRRTALNAALYAKFQSDGFQPPSGGQSAVTVQTQSYWGITASDEGLTDALKALVSALQPPAPSQSTPADDPVASAYPVATVSAALEREEALLAHLNDNHDYYRGRVFAALPSQTQRDMLHSRGYDLPGIELRSLGREGSKLAFPLVGSIPPDVQAYFDRIITKNEDLDANWTTNVVLPTPGIYLQTRLSDCDACEPYIQHIRGAEVTKRRAEAHVVAAQADQARLEAERFRKRLDATPPLLDNPTPVLVPEFRVQLEKEPTEEPPPN